MPTRKSSISCFGSFSEDAASPCEGSARASISLPITTISHGDNCGIGEFHIALVTPKLHIQALLKYADSRGDSNSSLLHSMLSPLRYSCGPIVRAWSRHDVTLSSPKAIPLYPSSQQSPDHDVTLTSPAQTKPLYTSSQQSPFDYPKPQKSSKLLTLNLEIQLKSYRSRLEARKQLLSASIKALARLEAGPSGHQETNGERLARIADRRDCVNWITKHRHAIERLQRHILQLEKRIKSLVGFLTC